MLNENIQNRIRDMFLKYIEEKKALPWQSGLVFDNKAVAFGKGRGGRPYRGINALMAYMDMALNDFDSCEFLTAKEINSRGGRLKQGSHGIPIVWHCFAWFHEGRKVSDKEAAQLAENGEDVRRKYLGMKHYYVFNLAQTDLNYEKIQKIESLLRENRKDETAEGIVARYTENGGPKIKVVGTTIGGAEGSYSPGTDTVSIFPIGAYKTSTMFYSTLFHELVHSTGHEKRLNRKSDGAFGSSAYAKEELVAETGASLLVASCADLDQDFENQYAYLESWQKHIKGKNFAENFATAFNKAVEAVQYILGKAEEHTKCEEEVA